MLTEPVVPPTAITLVTNSAKFAHYAPGLVGRQVRFASLEGCVVAALTGRVPRAAPRWCADGVQKPPRVRDGGTTPRAPLAPLARLAPLAPLTVAPARRVLHTHVAPVAVRALRRVLR